MTPVAPVSSIAELEAYMRTQPQPDCYKTTHKFVNGMYCRTFWMPAGHLVTGARQRHDHLIMVLSGETLIYTEDGGTLKFCAGDVASSPAGSKRAVLSLTEAELMTIHRLPDPDERDLEKVWNALVDAEGQPRLFDANNRLRDPALPGASLPLEQQ
jgi:hypothetical protein